MNWLKNKLDKKAVSYGIWLSIGSHVAAEMAAVAGFDWALLDLEHGLSGEMEVLHMLQVLSRSDTASVVRVPASDSDLVKKAVDFGASGIMAPMLNDAVAAERFAQSLRYPPDGNRGLTSSSRAADFGYGFKHYFQQANASITGIVQIETKQAVENAKQIAAIDGVDVLFIGYSDLSLSLGYYGDLEAPALKEAEMSIIEACQLYGKHAGVLVKPGMDVSQCTQKGFSLVALGSDIGCLRAGYDNLLMNKE